MHAQFNLLSSLQQLLALFHFLRLHGLWLAGNGNIRTLVSQPKPTLVSVRLYSCSQQQSGHEDLHVAIALYSKGCCLVVKGKLRLNTAHYALVMRSRVQLKAESRPEKVT